ncbi:MAG: ketoacyl-ACP synthase III [Candidatus Dormibacteraeota bacterium]|nr:ketoacyl-ACP synthase III [Candidatus Dormibacteraeota bacterium]MBO0762294.1 ketoacyl-ACP synthase III [Candidatus Dormibacteraeota bacterium]
MTALKAAIRARSSAVPLRTFSVRGRPAAIAGLGTHVPAKVLTNADLERMVDTSDHWIRERTGIERRHVAEPGTATFELATQASERALEDAAVTASDLDMIIVSTSSPDGPFPSVACRVQEQLGVPGCPAVDLLAACSGFQYALSMAHSYVATEQADTVLVVGAEVLTRYVDWTDRGTCVLFSDGAGAAIVRPAERGPGILSWCLGADGRGYDQITCGDVPRGPFAAHDPEPKIGMKGPDVFKFATDIFIRMAYAVAEQADMRPEDIDLWVPHQANGRIIETAARRIGLPLERVAITIGEYGNNSTATVPLALAHSVREGCVRPGDRVLLAGFGSGLTWGACLFEWE